MMMSVVVWLGALFQFAPTLLAVKLEAFMVDAQQCNFGAIKNGGSYSSLGAIAKHSSKNDCLLAGGFRSDTPAVSQNSVAELSKMIGGKGFTIEMWIQPLRQLGSAAPMIAFGADKISPYPCANNFVVRNNSVMLRG
jgi:hypothetical protein